jgi:hypothetical protein
MKKFKFWDFKDSLDDYFFEFVNIIQKVLFFFKSLSGKFNFMKKNIELKEIFKNKEGFLVANGPSINKQDLKPLKNKVTFFLNRSFLHKDYDYIKPKFHIFIDPKLATGEWDITFLDVVIKKNPDVIFLLNAKWYYLDKFQPYIHDKRFKIFWVNMNLFTTPFHKNRKIDLTKITYGFGAPGVALVSMIYMGMKNIYFIGNDGNGLCYELLNLESHFYGTNPENHKKSMSDYSKDLYSMSLSYKNMRYFNEYAKQIDVSIFNCTAGGALNMFERKKYEDVINEK